jgi:hypothetical protein
VFKKERTLEEEEDEEEEEEEEEVVDEIRGPWLRDPRLLN